LTEDSLVAALRAIVETRAADSGIPTRIVLGIGDDAAVWQPSRSHLSVISTDALVEGVHFELGSMSPSAVGKRAMAANLSDIAAMGARPVLATVALGVAPGTDEAWILDCYRGMSELAATFRTAIVGGDIVRAPAMVLSLTVVGEVSRSRLKRRDGGRPGDVLAVTGALGASRAGLELLRRSLPVAADARAAALAAFETPTPRVAEGRYLAASAHVHALMDSSDGLSTDLARLARSSACGATLCALPVHPAAVAVARAAGHEPRDYALDGGEDFELIAAVSARGFGHLARRFATAFGKPLLRLGHLEAELGLRIAVDGGAADVLQPAGWDHLRRSTGSG
jgi:thiamine-monophosphate kinase